MLYVGTHLNCIVKSMQFKWVPTTYMSTQIKAYVVGTHFNCIDKLMQYQMHTHNTCFYKEADKNTLL